MFFNRKKLKIPKNIQRELSAIGYNQDIEKSDEFIRFSKSLIEKPTKYKPATTHHNHQFNHMGGIISVGGTVSTHYDDNSKLIALENEARSTISNLLDVSEEIKNNALFYILKYKKSRKLSISPETIDFLIKNSILEGTHYSHYSNVLNFILLNNKNCDIGLTSEQIEFLVKNVDVTKDAEPNFDTTFFDIIKNIPEKTKQEMVKKKFYESGNALILFIRHNKTQGLYLTDSVVKYLVDKCPLTLKKIRQLESERSALYKTESLDSKQKRHEEEIKTRYLNIPIFEILKLYKKEELSTINPETLDLIIKNSDPADKDFGGNLLVYLLRYMKENDIHIPDDFFDYLIKNSDLNCLSLEYNYKPIMYLIANEIKINENLMDYMVKNTDLNSVTNQKNTIFNLLVFHPNTIISENSLNYLIDNNPWTIINADRLSGLGLLILEKLKNLDINNLDINNKKEVNGKTKNNIFQLLTFDKIAKICGDKALSLSNEEAGKIIKNTNFKYIDSSLFPIIAKNLSMKDIKNIVDEIKVDELNNGALQEFLKYIESKTNNIKRAFFD